MTYNFHDYNRKPGDLPEDINARVEQVAKGLKDPELDASLIRFRENKWYGDANCLDKKTGRINATFHFEFGMCKQYKKIEWRSDTVFDFISVLNPDLDTRKKR